MFNFEDSCKHYYDDYTSVPEHISEQISTFNYVWNKLFRRMLIDFLCENATCKKSIDTVNRIKNRNFTGIESKVEKLPWGDEIPYFDWAENEDATYQGDPPYELLLTSIPNEIYEAVYRIYQATDVEKSQFEISEACILVFDDFASLLCEIDNDATVVLTEENMCTLLNFIEFFLRKEKVDGKRVSIYENRAQYMSEEEISIAMVAYLIECEVPVEIAKKYANYYVDYFRQNYEGPEITGYTKLEWMRESIESITLQMLTDSYIDCGCTNYP